MEQDDTNVDGKDHICRRLISREHRHQRCQKLGHCQICTRDRHYIKQEENVSQDVSLIRNGKSAEVLMFVDFAYHTDNEDKRKATEPR